MTDSSAPGAMAWAGQVLLYGAFALAIGTFSQWPVYRHLEADQAIIKLSFSHTGQPVGDCRKPTQAELDKTPLNMRRTLICPRERSPVRVEVDLGGERVLSRELQPTGLKRDGASTVYQRLVVPAGEQHIVVGLNDDARQQGHTHTLDRTISLRPRQVLVVDFDSEHGEITLR